MLERPYNRIFREAPLPRRLSGAGQRSVKCRRFKRLWIISASFPRFGRGLDSHRPPHKSRWLYCPYAGWVAENTI